MPTVYLREVPHVYDVFGQPRPDRPTLLFIHGWLLSRHYWHPIATALAADFHCITYDLRGFGESQRSPDHPLPSAAPSYTLTAYAADAIALLDTLKIPQAWVIGHSLGGSIALWAAHQDRDRIQGVIGVNAGGGLYLKEEFEKFRAVGQQLVKFRPRWLGQAPGLDWVFARDSVAQPIARSWGRQRVMDFVTAAADAARESLLAATTEAEVLRLPQLVNDLVQPVHFITGTQDRVMEPKYVRHLASFHRLYQETGANVTELANCGHLSMVEQPDAVVAAIQSMIAPTLGDRRSGS